MTDLAPTATRLAARAKIMRAQWQEEDRAAAAADLLVAEHSDTLNALGESETRARNYQSGGPIANLPMGEPERPIFRTCACGADSGKLKICVDCQRRGYDEFNASRQLPRTEVLGRAAELVYGKRGDNYGHPLDNHTATAEMFAVYLNRKYGTTLTLDADDTCWFNIFQKASRDANDPIDDNPVDVAGYAENLAMGRAERMRREDSVKGG